MYTITCFHNSYLHGFTQELRKILQNRRGKCTWKVCAQWGRGPPKSMHAYMGEGQGGYDIINICVRTMHMTPKQLGFSMENKFQSWFDYIMSADIFKN